MSRIRLVHGDSTNPEILKQAFDGFPKFSVFMSSPPFARLDEAVPPAGFYNLALEYVKYCAKPDLDLTIHRAVFKDTEDKPRFTVLYTDFNGVTSITSRVYDIPEGSDYWNEQLCNDLLLDVRDEIGGTDILFDPFCGEFRMVEQFTGGGIGIDTDKEALLRAKERLEAAGHDVEVIECVK